MFYNNDHLKQKFRDFWQNELEEIKQNKIRVFALIFSVFIAVALMFTEDDGEKIDMGNFEKLEESTEMIPKKNSDDDKKLNTKVISVKKAKDKIDKEKVIAVIGANSEELYIGDPFQSSEEKPVNIEQQTLKIDDIPSQIPLIPPESSFIPVQKTELPPIPDMSKDLPPIPSAVPSPSPADEFILTGTAINSGKKAAVVKKVSINQGKGTHEENLILAVGDFLDGRQIVDITDGALIFDDGGEIRSSYFDVDISIELNEIDDENAVIPENYTKFSANADSFAESNIQIISDKIEDYEKNFNIPDTELSETVLKDEVKILIDSDENQPDLNPSITGQIEKSESTSSNNTTVDDGNFATDANSLPNVQKNIFAMGNNSP